MITYTARKEFQLPLFIGIDRVWEYIDQPASNAQLHYHDGPYIFDIPSFNEDVIREAILNSVCHRLMRINSDVVVKQYPDSIVITNAGGFPVGVNKDNILTTNSRPRSKLVCDVLQKTGLIERSGQGVDKMYYYSIMDGKALPDYSGTDDYQVCLKLDAPIRDEAFVVYIRHIQNERDDNNKLNVFQLLTLYRVWEGNSGMVDRTIAEQMVAEGYLGIDGDNYILSPKYYKKTKLNSIGTQSVPSRYPVGTQSIIS